MRTLRDYAFDWIAWAIFASIPVTIFWQASTSLVEQGGASGGPLQNAAYYPRLLAVFMSALVLIQAVRLVLRRVAQTSPLKRDVGTVRAFIGTAIFFIYLLALPTVGFHIATPILCLSLFLLLQMGIVQAIAATLVLWLTTSLIFEGLLNVVLPVGMFNIALFN